MQFQIVDNKSDCLSVYSHDIQDIVKEPDESQFTRTWAYHPRLRGKDIEYAQLYVGGKTLDDVCPAWLRPEWEDILQKHAAFQKSFRLSKVSTFEHCFYDLVPNFFPKKFFQIKSLICEHVLEHYPRPKNYDDLVKLSELVYDIKLQRLNIDLAYLNRKSYDDVVKNFAKKIKKIKPFIQYNIFGSVTGRLAIKHGSFPILNLQKEYRRILKPNNDIFVELDFNGSQLRVLLALNGVEPPPGDIHDWNLKQLQGIYNEDLTRDQVKNKIFSWLYNNQASLGIPKLEALYDKKKALDKWWDGNKVTTPFGDELKADEWHALNYLIQRAEATNFYRRAAAINDMLREKKSCITALIHDSLLIDFSMEDKPLLGEIIKTFGNTDLGKWKTNCKVGKTFGDMKDV